MDEPRGKPRTPRFECLPPGQKHDFRSPSQRIHDGDDLKFFLGSTTYRDITTLLSLLNRSMFPSLSDGEIKSWNLSVRLESSATIKALKDIISMLSSLTEKAPPDTGPRRFGNVAFRQWYQIAEDSIPTLLDDLIVHHVPGFNGTKPEMRSEIQSYLLGSLGSAQRLDYGTGHELSFLAFLGCLMKVGALKPGEERTVVVGVIQPYLELIRKVIMTYNLEPAGSHGVWGLDDHCFLPYIFGSAQLGPPIRDLDADGTPIEGSCPNAPSPASVTNKGTVEAYKDANMYFSAIQFIYDVKKGPFWEHSPILYDISGIKDGWGKINKGMLKMFVAEVLGKFPVVQHFPFGSLFKWERDPEAVAHGTSLHAEEQPKSKDTTAPQSATASTEQDPSAAGVGTQAPWARSSGASMPSGQSSTGIPTTRAPWPNGQPPRQINIGRFNTGSGSGPPKKLPVQPRFEEK
ncbi:serine/threonine-protein phosphatase 2A activator 1 [Polychaeton citri CBS 116435]|uniref:Serine/threonine-protein phosphatase 2A activator n=1 Tax=Polychaeton citri CBS 116435 TaxID=1314669 RepID=A0A9P4Q4W6_9PEZI|nr:serine/threonine-protein phosphatase 2A activator 1 [Polychaeton citri CBS 116435]